VIFVVGEDLGSRVSRVSEMAELDERHHTFLQALMRRGPLPERESKSMYRELFGTSGGSLPCLEFLESIQKNT